MATSAAKLGDHTANLGDRGADLGDLDADLMAISAPTLATAAPTLAPTAPTLGDHTANLGDRGANLGDLGANVGDHTAKLGATAAWPPTIVYAGRMPTWSPALAAQHSPRGRTLDLEAWVALPEDEAGELVDGFVAEEEEPDPIHGLAVSWLIMLFRIWLGDRGGFVFDSDVKYVVTPTRGRKPDVSVYLPARPAPPRRGAIREPPDIMVEVVSPSPADERRDRVDKMDEYAAFGVRYYWLVDPALGSLEIFELTAGRFTRCVAATAGVVRDVPGCPGLEIDLDQL